MSGLKTRNKNLPFHILKILIIKIPVPHLENDYLTMLSMGSGQSSPTGFSNLPPDVLRIIFAFVSEKDIFALSKT